MKRIGLLRGLHVLSLCANTAYGEQHARVLRHPANTVGHRLMQPVKILQVEIAGNHRGRLAPVAHIEDLEQRRSLPRGHLLLAEVVQNQERHVLERQNALVGLAGFRLLVNLAKSGLYKAHKPWYASVANTNTHCPSMVCDGGGEVAFATPHRTKAVEPASGLRDVCKCRREGKTCRSGFGQRTSLRPNRVRDPAIPEWAERATEVEVVERPVGELAKIGAQLGETPGMLLDAPRRQLLLLTHTRDELTEGGMVERDMGDDKAGTFTTTREISECPRVRR